MFSYPAFTFVFIATLLGCYKGTQAEEVPPGYNVPGNETSIASTLHFPTPIVAATPSSLSASTLSIPSLTSSQHRECGLLHTCHTPSVPRVKPWAQQLKKRDAGGHNVALEVPSSHINTPLATPSPIPVLLDDSGHITNTKLGGESLHGPPHWKRGARPPPSQYSVPSLSTSMNVPTFTGSRNMSLLAPTGSGGGAWMHNHAAALGNIASVSSSVSASSILVGSSGPTSVSSSTISTIGPLNNPGRIHRIAEGLMRARAVKAPSTTAVTMGTSITLLSSSTTSKNCTFKAAGIVYDPPYPTLVAPAHGRPQDAEAFLTAVATTMRNNNAKVATGTKSALPSYPRHHRHAKHLKPRGENNLAVDRNYATATTETMTEEEALFRILATHRPATGLFRRDNHEYDQATATIDVRSSPVTPRPRVHLGAPGLRLKVRGVDVEKSPSSANITTRSLSATSEEDISFEAQATHKPASGLFRRDPEPASTRPTSQSSALPSFTPRPASIGGVHLPAPSLLLQPDRSSTADARDKVTTSSTTCFSIMTTQSPTSVPSSPQARFSFNLSAWTTFNSSDVARQHNIAGGLLLPTTAFATRSILSPSTVSTEGAPVSTGVQPRVHSKDSLMLRADTTPGTDPSTVETPSDPPVDPTGEELPDIEGLRRGFFHPAGFHDPARGLRRGEEANMTGTASRQSSNGLIGLSNTSTGTAVIPVFTPSTLTTRLRPQTSSSLTAVAANATISSVPVFRVLPTITRSHVSAKQQTLVPVAHRVAKGLRRVRRTNSTEVVEENQWTATVLETGKPYAHRPAKGLQHNVVD